MSVWNTFTTIKGTHFLNCAGNQLMQPWTDLHDGYFTMKMRRHRRAVNIDHYCDDWMELDEIHPAYLN